MRDRLKPNQFNTFDKLMLIWVGVSSIFWIFYILFIEFIFQILYFYVWVLFFGSCIWINKDILKEKLRSWNLNPFLKFVLLGVVMVLVEETFAALFNHLSEGFSLNLFLLRILQFWIFNLLAFTPWFIGWFILIKKFYYSTREIFYLAGICGLFFEGIIWLLFSNPLGFLFMTSLMIFTYGIIIFLSVISLKEEQRSNKTINKYLKYSISVIVPVLFSVLIGGVIIAIFQPIFPGLFPPEKFGFSY